MNKVIESNLLADKFFKTLIGCLALSTALCPYSQAEDYKLIDKNPYIEIFEGSGRDYVNCANVERSLVTKGKDVCKRHGYSKDNCQVTTKTIYAYPDKSSYNDNPNLLKKWNCAFEIYVSMQKIDIVPQANEVLIKKTDYIVDTHVLDLVAQINQNNASQGVFLSYNDQKFDPELFGSYKVLALDTDKRNINIDLGDLCLTVEYRYSSSIDRYANGVVDTIGNVRNSLFTLSLVDTKESCHPGEFTFFGLHDPKQESRRFKAMISIR